MTTVLCSHRNQDASQLTAEAAAAVEMVAVIAVQMRNLILKLYRKRIFSLKLSVIHK